MLPKSRKENILTIPGNYFESKLIFVKPSLFKDIMWKLFEKTGISNAMDGIEDRPDITFPEWTLNVQFIGTELLDVDLTCSC